MSPDLKIFLSDIRQHAGFPALLKAIDFPKLPRFRPNSEKSLENIGANMAYYSGKRDQHIQWLALLTGQLPKEED